MSLLRCPNASSVGWGPPPGAADGGGGGGREAKNKGVDGARQPSAAAAAAAPLDAALYPRKRRRASAGAAAAADAEAAGTDRSAETVVEGGNSRAGTGGTGPDGGPPSDAHGGGAAAADAADADATISRCDVRNGTGNGDGPRRIAGVTVVDATPSSSRRLGDDDDDGDDGGSSVVLTFDSVRPPEAEARDGNDDPSSRTTDDEAANEVVLTGNATVSVLSGRAEIMGYRMDGRFPEEEVRVSGPDGTWSSSLTIVNAGGRGEEGPTQVRISSLRSDGRPREGGGGGRGRRRRRTFDVASRADVRSAVTVPERWVKAADAVLADLEGCRTTELDVRERSDGDQSKREGGSPTASARCEDDAAVDLDGYGNPILPEPGSAAHDDGGEEDVTAAPEVSNGPCPTEAAPAFDKCRSLVCGAKGVGKSTYVRYLANRILSSQPHSWLREEPSVSEEASRVTVGGGAKHRRRRRRVAILDCDVGQPELGPPGLITLTVLEGPLLSPPHVHMICGGQSRPTSDCDDDGDGAGGGFTAAPYHASARFYGHVSSKADPVAYTAAIASLVSEYERLADDEAESAAAAPAPADSAARTERDRLPLVVNTDGWVKGMGYEILSSILDVVRPGHVVQIVGAARAKFFDMTGHATEGRAIHAVEAFGRVTRLPTERGPASTPPASRGVSPVPPGAGGRSPVAEGGGPKPILASTAAAVAVADRGGGTTMTVSTTSNLRSLRLASYFLGGFPNLLATGATFHPASGGIFDPDCTVALALAAMRPYAVPFESVLCSVPSLADLLCNNPSAADCGGITLEDELVLQSLNGSIVGLCRWGGSNDDPSVNFFAGRGVVETPPAGMNTALLPCAGLGIVRSVDRARRIFFILTPIPAEQLSDPAPNVIVRAQVQLPVECVFRGVHSESFPNQNCDGISSGIGDDVMKSRNAVVRK